LLAQPSESDSNKNSYDKKVEGDFSLPVDLIRTVAILLVMVLHVSNEYYTAIQGTPLDSALYWGTSTIYKSLSLPCVPLFVMLSGALLLRQSKVHEPIRIFLRKRLNRIGLAFAFWSIIYLAWAFFVTNTPVTLNNVVLGIEFGIFTGPYYHFWFLYLIVGLYLITPILRAVIGFKDPKILKYLIIVWFLGVGVVPLINLFFEQTLNTSLFVLGGSIGYFVLGTYLQRVNVRISILGGLFFLGLGWTIASTWGMNFLFSPVGQNNFFLDYITANVIIMSVTLFMILSKFPPDWPGSRHPLARRAIHVICINTLPIYLFHVIILGALQRGYFGFKLSLTTMNPIVGIPLIATVTFSITLALVLVMKRVPVLKKLIG
jgi:surface polysaccharide O-acyltransferase-like enzyme